MGNLNTKSSQSCLRGHVPYVFFARSTEKLEQSPSALHPQTFHQKADTDKHDSLFELETLERNLDSMERAVETKKHWQVSNRTHMKSMLTAARVTDEAFHEETDDGTFQTTRFSGKVRVCRA